MKAVLVLDEMPENCIGCPLEYDTMTCRGANKSIISESFDKRPDWCPLRKYPEFLSWYQLGWDDCLDSITEANNEEK